MTRLREQELRVAAPHAVWRPVSFADVTIDDQFWAPRLRLNRERTIPFQYKQLRETGRLDALRLDWRQGQEPVPHIFWESDIAKWIEAASYSLATHPDPALDTLVDETIALLASAQQPDGYLNVYFTVVHPGRRWTDLRDAHELYCAGHLIEAGVAHYEATGKRALLDVVRGFADYIDTVFGTAPGQKRGYCGHPEIELALVKLYHATGEDRYLRLAQYFVDERGRQPYYFDLEAGQRGEPGFFEFHLAAGDLRQSRAYNQSHAPVREQDEVVGHAVRATYLYCAMADLAGEMGDETLRAACRRLWDHLTTRRMYITGGIGSAAQNEGFTRDYDLPNETAYAETCAAIGLVFWAHRMTRLERDARYADVLERALYNGVMSGVSHDGTRFFYDNPLASDGGAHRQEWFGVACCPPNLARLLASLGQYIYAHNDAEVVVHLYVQSTGQFRLGDQAVTIRQETDYPWDGKVTLRFELERAAVFALRLRLPGWNRAATLTVNDEAVDVASSVEKGYITIGREWSQTDTVQLDLAMPVERVYANPKVRQDVGCVALQRGPLVYCLEEVDNAASTRQVVLPRDAAVTASLNAAEFGGLVVVHSDAGFADAQGWDGALYHTGGATLTPIRMTAIPYYAWDNRQPGDMCVWIHERQETAHEPETT